MSLLYCARKTCIYGTSIYNFFVFFSCVYFVSYLFVIYATSCLVKEEIHIWLSITINLCVMVGFLYLLRRLLVLLHVRSE